MCGIIGYIGQRPVLPILIEGLRRLEYRGYDSAGIAVVNNSHVEIRRSPGKLVNLEAALAGSALEGRYGLGHTRWATHGRPTEENAHPHRDCTGRLVVVHNGIIENYLELKSELQRDGHRFVTETDTEIVAHLVESEMRGDGLEPAVRRALVRLRGLFALVLMSADDPDTLVAARYGPPLVVGLGDGEYFVASDVPAILSHTRDVVFLEDGELAVVRRDGVRFSDLDGSPRNRQPQRVSWDPVMAERAGYKHFMLKEIFEQPRALGETLVGRLAASREAVTLDEIGLPDEALAAVQRVQIVACGTSWHAGLVGKFLIEALARVPVDVDYGSEFRYRNPIVGTGTLAVAITQSGETADTLAALREAKSRHALTLAICNVVGSMATREAGGVVYTHAGPEIGVASTKAFTTQLVALYLLAVHMARIRGTLDANERRAHLEGLGRLPQLVEETLQLAPRIEEIAGRFHNRHDFLYLGRGIHYPIALEGALKLKEVSYIHAEGYPAGEMKHGPIALIDEAMPVVAVAPDAPATGKMIGNIQEARARGASIIAVTTAGDSRIAGVLDEEHDAVLPLPPCPALTSPIVAVVPLQLLAYAIAVRRGCDVDQPRNLAKSVTVE
ncbi:MAG TPA: glutamine--fructose-6-phosphate transaminase (isomerizing) [Vicinamibacterales bacterium]